MKKILLAFTAMSIFAASAAFAGEACKKCSGADKNAPCTCPKDKSSCEKDKSADKDKAGSDKDKGTAEKKK